MAKLARRIEIPLPPGEDTQAGLAWQEAELAALRESLRALNVGLLVGEELRWPRGDGYARYLVVKESPLRIAHIAIGDAREVEDVLVRGLNIDDVRAMVGHGRRLDRLLGRRTGESAGARKTVDQVSAINMAMDCLLIRADQWRDMGAVKCLDIEEMYEASPEYCAEMTATYQQAYLVLQAVYRTP